MIRTARPGDISALARIEKQFGSDRMCRSQLAEYVRKESCYFTVECDLDTPPRGYSMLVWRFQHRFARLYSIAVDRSYHGVGVGRALLRDSIDFAARAGFESVRLEVSAVNEPAKALYRSEGFAKIGVIQDYYSGNVAAMSMELKLGRG